MANYRITPCIHYVCNGNCDKGRVAEHNGYCQKCGWYQPRARVKYRNAKKDKLLKLKQADREY